MKGFYLGISVLLTAMILILAFENMFAQTRYFLLLFTSVDNLGLFLIILIIALLGAITGFFYAMSLMAALSGRETDDY